MPSQELPAFCSRTHVVRAEGLSRWCRELGALPLPDRQEVSCGQQGAPGSQGQVGPRTSGAPERGRSPAAVLCLCLA